LIFHPFVLLGVTACCNPSANASGMNISSMFRSLSITTWCIAGVFLVHSLQGNLQEISSENLLRVAADRLGGTDTATAW